MHEYDRFQRVASWCHSMGSVVVHHWSGGLMYLQIACEDVDAACRISPRCQLKIIEPNPPRPLRFDPTVGTEWPCEPHLACNQTDLSFGLVLLVGQLY